MTKIPFVNGNTWDRGRLARIPNDSIKPIKIDEILIVYAAGETPAVPKTRTIA